MCRQEARQSALALAKPNTRTFSTANVFNAKDESWYMLVRFNVEKLNNENLYCIPLCMGSQQKRSATPPGKQSYWCFFPWADLHNVRAFAKTASLTLIAATLANAWQEPCTILAIDWRVSREQEPCWRKPGKTRHNPAELNWRKPGTQRNLAAPSGAAEPSGTRRNPAEPGGNLAETWQNPAEKK